MSTFIVTGNYTADAMRGMIQNPSDRAAAVKPLVEAGGGKLVSYYATLGVHDFLMIVETNKLEGLMAALIAAGATNTVANMQTVQAFSAGEFMVAHRQAGEMAKSFQPATAH